MRTLPDRLTKLALPSGPVEVDEAGYLTDPDLWTSEFAEYVAKSENIDPSPLHWEIIDFMRDSLAEHGVAVDVRHLLKYLQKTRGIDKTGAKTLLFDAFPYGYVKQACKMSGMKQPRAWSTG